MDKLVREVLGNFVPVEGSADWNSAVMNKCLKRLFEYQDTGLTPAEMKQIMAATKFAKMSQEDHAELASYRVAKITGQFIFLPCKIGDALYLMNHESGVMVKRIAVEFRCFSDGIYIVDSCGKSWRTDDIGKTVFLTLREADAAKGGDA